VSIGRVVIPATVVVEVFVACHFAGNVTSGLRAVLAAIAVEAPIIEFIVRGEPIDLVVERPVILVPGCAAAECGMLIGDDGVVVPPAERFAAAVKYIHDSCASVGVYINPVFSVVLNLERKVGRVNFDRIVIIEMPNV
jgi:hypothetical protein